MTPARLYDMIYSIALLVSMSEQELESMLLGADDVIEAGMHEWSEDELRVWLEGDQ